MIDYWQERYCSKVVAFTRISKHPGHPLNQLVNEQIISEREAESSILVTSAYQLIEEELGEVKEEEAYRITLDILMSFEQIPLSMAERTLSAYQSFLQNTCPTCKPSLYQHQ